MSLPILRLPKEVYPRKPKSLPLMRQYPIYSLDHNGVNGYVNCGNDASLDITNAITIGAWAKASTNRMIVWRGVDNLTGMWGLDYDANVLRLLVANGHLFAIADLLNGTVIVTDGKWHYVVGTFDGADMKLYVDGNPDGTKAKITLPLATVTTTFIGAFQGTALFFKGIIALPFIYNRALSLAEIQRNMRNPMNPDRNGLVQWLPMVEGQGLNVADYSGSGNNGTLNGGVSWRDLMKYEIPAAANL